ncbi:protein DEHYDRATION-INDUCED 19 homolog 5-like [Phragmites australis]|uniref:protein DEHYDRATION-INDUCED 19 homolog 5-like n=1 Tax=Phragmites australis TaxID=29695 RepID=UPI002D7884D7|nr:protein DEHYDRATION-INDUCED 19 homolog 5-like [Phragmites australis]
MEVEACYNYGYLPAGRHQPPYAPPPPHPAEDGELWEYFPCPFCYIEVEVPFISNHLQEEHCFDTKNAVCPICANNLGKDMAAHFRVQHSHLLKRRKPSRPSSWPAAANNSAPGKGTTYFEEPQHYRMSSRPYQDPAPDPLLSQFICSITQTDHAISGDAEKSGVAMIPDDHRLNKGLSDDASKLGLQERLQRIEFLTEILMSTIL